MKILYTGSFSPFHSGHQYVYDLACRMFGKENVWIGIGQSASKQVSDLEHLKFSIHPITRNVICYSGLTSDVVKEQGFDLLVRGVRPGRSLEDENDLLYWNNKLCGVDTILIPTPPSVNQISSSAIRVLHGFNKTAEICELMNSSVYERWVNKEKRINVYFGKCCSGKSTYLKLQNLWLVEFDLVWKNYIDFNMPKGDVQTILDATKEAFYKKDSAFIGYVEHFAHEFQWNKFFKDFAHVNGVAFDIPVIAQYWNYIPVEFRSRLNLVKISTSDVNREAFAKARNVNPKLVECNDYFYSDPEFWDEEIVIR